MTRQSPPRLATRLLAVFLPADRSDAVIGDLSEEFELLAAEDPRRAARWYWSQVRRSIVPLVWARIRSGQWLKTLGAALLGYVAMAAIVMSSDVAMSPLMRFGLQVYSMFSLLVAAPAMVLGGYLASRLRPRAWLVLAVLSGVGGVLSLAATGDAAPLWYQLALIVIGPVASMIGGRFASVRSKLDPHFELRPR